MTLVIKHSTSQNDPKPTKTIKYFAQIFNIVKGYHKLSSAEKPYYFQWDAYLGVAHNRWWGLKENIRWTWKLFVYLAKFVLLSIFKMNCNQEAGGVLPEKKSK